MKKFLTLSLFVFGCGGTTGYVPPETNNPTCQGLPGANLIGQVCMSEDGCDFYWHCLTDVDQKPIVVCDGRQSASSCANDAGTNCTEESVAMKWDFLNEGGVSNHLCRNAVRTICDGQFASQTPMVPAMNENLIGTACGNGGVYQCVVSSGLPLVIPGEIAQVRCLYPYADAGTSNCGPECTGAGLYDSCTGLWADCVTSLENCPLRLGTPLSCQNGNVCYQPSGVSWKPDFAVNCVAGDGFTWKDDAGQYSCEDYSCLSGANCTTINAAGVTLTGTCL